MKAQRPTPPIRFAAAAYDGRLCRVPRGRRCGQALTREELSTAAHALRETILRRTRCGEPVPAELRHVLQRIVDLLVIGESSEGFAGGTESTSGLGESGDELVDAATVAAMVGCSPEWVRRIADQLGGTKVAGRWLFPRRNIIDHIEGREAG